MRPTTLAEILDKFIEPEPNTGCWLWTGSRNVWGYGRISLPRSSRSRSRVILAHRFLYEQTHGAVPDGHVLDHRCFVRPCVNPAHLSAVSNHENCQRRDPLRVKTRCKRGHPFSPDNTYFTPGRLHRVCIECRKVTQARYTERHRAL